MCSYMGPMINGLRYLYGGGHRVRVLTRREYITSQVVGISNANITLQYYYYMNTYVYLYFMI